MAENVVALNADVVWRTNTGQAERDIESLRRSFHESTNQMSTQTLRLQSAQERLDRALLKHGSTSRAARDAEVALRKVMAETTVTAEHQTSAFQRSEHSLNRLGRGALVGSGAIRGLARTVAFASTSFLGGFGLVYALRKTVEAASTLQEETEKTGVVFGTSAKDVQRWASTLALSFGVSEEAALKSAGVFGNMFHSLHIGQQDAATMSKRLVELAADMASFNNASPEETLAALSSGLAGQVRPLRQYGVFLSQDRIKAEAYADGIAKTGKSLDATQKLQASYNIILKDTAIQQGDVARNSESLSVAQSKANAELTQSEAIIGDALRPELAHLANDAAKYLDRLNKTGELQRDVNRAVRTGGQVVHTLSDAMRDARTVADPLVHALGGVGDTAKAMIEAFALYKLAKIALAIRGVGKAAEFTRRELVLMEAAGAKGLGAGAAGAAGGGSGGGKALPFLIAASAAPFLYSLERQGFREGLGASFQGLSSDQTITLAEAQARAKRLAKQLRRQGLGNDQIRGVLRGEGFSEQEIDYALSSKPGQDVSDRQPGGSPGGAAAPGKPSKGGGGGPGRKHGFSLTYALQLEVARAAAGQGSVLGTAQDELRYVKAQIAAGRLNKQGILDALSQEAQLEDQIDGILSSAAAAKEAKAAKREAAAKKRREAEKRHREHERAREKRERAKQKAADDAWFKEVWGDVKFLTDQRVQRAKQLNDAAKAAGKKGSGDGVDFFSEAVANFRTYGSNVGGVLSGQDARSLLAGIALTLRSIDGHTKTTAKTNTQIVKAGPHPAKTAAALAEVGAWTH